MYVYISEKSTFNDFDDESALFWLEEQVVYGDWTGGVQGDGSYVKTGQITVSEVSLLQLSETSEVVLWLGFIFFGNFPLKAPDTISSNDLPTKLANIPVILKSNRSTAKAPLFW